MRLSAEQIQAITQTVAQMAGDGAETYLFGSRLDDAAKGGDVDILIETEQRLPRLEQGKLKMALEQRIGLPVDLLIHVRTMKPTPFQIIARNQATRLRGAA